MLTTPSTDIFDAFTDELKATGAEFTVDHDVTEMLGIDISHGTDRSITISQGTYIRQLLTRFNVLLGQSFVRSALAFRLVILKHVTTETQYADALTKAPTPLFLQLLQQLMRGRADMPLAAKIYPFVDRAFSLCRLLQ